MAYIQRIQQTRTKIEKWLAFVALLQLIVMFIGNLSRENYFLEKI
jgi:hypothetical protein